MRPLMMYSGHFIYQCALYITNESAAELAVTTRLGAPGNSAARSHSPLAATAIIKIQLLGINSG